MPRFEMYLGRTDDLFTVTDMYGNEHKDESLESVVRRLTEGRGQEWHVAVQRKPIEFIVTYGGSKKRPDMLWYGWAQGRKVQAIDHFEALLDRIVNENHGDGTRYAVTGPERGSMFGDEIVTRFYRLNIVKTPDEATFSFYWPATGTTHYKVTEVAF
jgi:hypothetical protein